MKTSLPPQFSDYEILLFVVIAIWSLAIKGFALYRAGSLQDRGWFIALFLLNTAGILELYYLLVASKKK